MTDLNKFKNPVDPIIPITSIKDSIGRSWIKAPDTGTFQWQIDNLFHVWFHRKPKPEENEVVVFGTVQYKIEHIYDVGNAKRCPVQMIRIN